MANNMRGSGVYVINVDESFTSFDVINMSVLVPMWTKRGKKYQAVTRDNFKTKVGYDLLYNSNYAGLSKLLDSISSVNVWRINKNACYGNAVFTKNGDNFSYAGITDPSMLSSAILLESESKSASSGSYSGSLGFKPVLATVKIKTPAGAQIGASDSHGAITGTDLTGTVDADTRVVTIAFGTSYTTFPYAFKIEYEEDTGLACIIYMESAGNWDNLAVKIERYVEIINKDYFTALNNTYDFGAPIVRETLVIKDSSGNTLATTNSSGVISGTNISGTVDTSGKITDLDFNGGAWVFPKTVTFEYQLVQKFYMVSVFSYNATLGAYGLIETGKISMDPDNALYANKVVFENVAIEAYADFDDGVLPIGQPTRVVLANGTDGSIPGAGDLDFTQVKKDPSFFVVNNGNTIAALQAKIMEWSAGKNKFYLGDFPNLATKEELNYYGQSLYATEKALVDFRADLESIDGLSAYVYPSVFRAIAFAKMFNATGYLGFPSAGYTYGAVSAEALFDFDVLDTIWRQYAKVNKINYIDDGDQGKVIWEQRTRYAFESDLSYASTVINLIFLGARCKRFMAPFEFKFIGPDDLSLIGTGLQSILDDYISLGFVWSASLAIPTFAQLKQSGARFLTVRIPVKFAEDGEEFTLEFHVEGKA